MYFGGCGSCLAAQFWRGRGLWGEECGRRRRGPCGREAETRSVKFVSRHQSLCSEIDYRRNRI